MGILDGVTRPGDVFRMRNWQHCAPTAMVTYGVGRKSKDVAVFMYFGVEPRNESTQLDLEAVMNKLGWYRK